MTEVRQSSATIRIQTLEAEAEEAQVVGAWLRTRVVEARRGAGPRGLCRASEACLPGECLNLRAGEGCKPAGPPLQVLNKNEEHLRTSGDSLLQTALINPTAHPRLVW